MIFKNYHITIKIHLNDCLSEVEKRGEEIEIYTSIYHPTHQRYITRHAILSLLLISFGDICSHDHKSFDIRH